MKKDYRFWNGGQPYIKEADRLPDNKIRLGGRYFLRQIVTQMATIVAIVSVYWNKASYVTIKHHLLSEVDDR